MVGHGNGIWRGKLRGWDVSGKCGLLALVIPRYEESMRGMIHMRDKRFFATSVKLFLRESCW